MSHPSLERLWKRGEGLAKSVSYVIVVSVHDSHSEHAKMRVTFLRMRKVEVRNTETRRYNYATCQDSCAKTRIPLFS